jgi:hypothetical protein
VRGEVDLMNKQVVQTHRMLGARFLETFTMADGKERAIIEYRLT